MEVVTEASAIIAPARRAVPLGDLVPAGPDVSVCIVNRNCRELLAACLRSLLDQDQDVSLEVIVVDNGSTDGAAAMVAERFPDVCLIRNQANLGFARANNQAARVARGAHLFFLNNDTEVPHPTLPKLVEFQRRHADAWLIGPRLRGADGQVQRGPRRFPSVATFLHRTCLLRWTGLFRKHYQQYCRDLGEDGPIQDVEVLMGAALFIRRDRFQALGGWDETFFFGGEDMALCQRAGERGRVVHAPQIEVMHHGRASTKLFIGQATRHIARGFVQYLRGRGTSRTGLFAYKVALTLDAPLQIALKLGQMSWRSLRGEWRKALKCWNDLKGQIAFLAGLWSFWRS